MIWQNVAPKKKIPLHQGDIVSSNFMFLFISIFMDDVKLKLSYQNGSLSLKIHEFLE